MERVKSTLALSIPITITLTYLFFTKSLYGYINFCYLGMGSFISNLHIDVYTIIIWLIITLYLIKKFSLYFVLFEFVLEEKNLNKGINN